MNDDHLGDAAEEHGVVAGPEHDGERLDRLLAAVLAPLSRSRCKQLIEAGLVSRDSATISDPSTRVKPGEAYRVRVPAPVPDTPRPQAIGLDIRYEDEHLLVLDKPAGLVVHPAPGNQEGTLVNALLAHCGDRLAGIGGVRRPGIVHRLDKDTSGLMVVAKSEPAHVALSADFAAHRIERAYQAVVWGVPSPVRGEIAGNIGRSPADRKKMAVVRRGGKEAITRYRVLRAFGGDMAALVECRLATGRTHQIRVHMTDIGHPLIGDPTYGNPRARTRLRRLADVAATARIAAFPRQALHAYLLAFEHPTTRKTLSFTSALPFDMAQLLSILEAL
ncbi:MAG TPA: RluA family pseudouridine synthase [Stellaceae bacterium]|jgi:23S rRNA pseudouridine1911/1915/1917 synthase